MLVLSRRADECIVIPSLGVTIKILRVDRRAARLGISAPSDVRIVRDEVLGSLPHPERASDATGHNGLDTAIAT